MSEVAEVSSKYLTEIASNPTPLGYKQTEVGMIPKDWEIFSLPEVIWYQEGPGLRKWQFKSKGLKVINVTNLQESGYLDLDRTDRHISWDEFEKTYKHFACDEGDLVIASSGNSYCKASTVRACDLPLLMNTSVIRFKPIGEFSKGYMEVYLKSPYFKDQIDLLITGGAQPNFGPAHLNLIKIPAPTCAKEQTAIANALSDVDALISELEKLIAKKQAIKTATMQQLLTGRTRLPQFALREDGTAKGTKPSELGEIPEDWEVVSFDQLKDKKDNWAITGGPFGSNLKASDYTENGVRVIQLQNIGDGVFKNDDFVYTSYQKANELISCNIYPDEIILSKMGDPVARACLIPHFHSRYVMCSDGIRLKVDNQRYSEKFVFYFLNYPLFRNQALDASTGSTRKRIGLSELRDLLLFAPQKEEQTVIATILSDMDEEIQALEQRLSKIRQIKQGMMQELLTGKTRLLRGETDG